MNRTTSKIENLQQEWHANFQTMKITTLAFFLLLTGLISPVLATEKPNIIIILADDLGYSDLGCYGGEISTPNIDALAKGGVRFTQFYNSARCCPSRASLMTGLYPTQAGIGDFTTAKPSPNRGPGYLGRLNNQCVTLAEVLKPIGYRSYYAGKWHMHEKTGPIKRGFDEFYGYTRGHSHDQYDADYYIRLPEGRRKEIDPTDDTFYATDVFNQYALEFIRQGQESAQPWFLFLGHSSPHFPIQAPASTADKYDPVYARGWDLLREDRFKRMEQNGLVNGDHWSLTTRSLVPVDRAEIANGHPGEPNPAWETLEPARQKDLARRMAVFAAMVEHVDQGVGKIVSHLKKTGELSNTLILFLSDNGACYEWGPFGFDGVSRRGINILHKGDDLDKVGGRGTYHSYGSAWANLSNTPLRLYKHFTHEGGIITPFIAHWPDGIRHPDQWIRQPAHVMDVMPTILEATGAEYPDDYNGNKITPVEGTSLLPAMKGKKLPERALGFDHQGAHAYRKGDWKVVWSKRMPYEIEWELYNLAEDRCETTDLADQRPDLVQEMAAKWEQWARRVNVIYENPSSTEESSQATKDNSFNRAKSSNSQERSAVVSQRNEKETCVVKFELQNKPNILLIFADDMGYSDLGCYGSGIETPNLDHLATTGLRLSQFYNTGRCCPSRASLLTGLYPHQAGVGHMLRPTRFPAYSDRLRKDAITLPEILKRAGYNAYMAGKWHLGWSDEGSPNARGFDRFYGSRGYVDSYFTVVPRTNIYLDDTIVNPAGKPPVNHLHPEREFYTTDTYTDYAIHFLEQHDRDKPFFLYMAYNAPHFPLHAKPEDTKKYRGRFKEEGWSPLRKQRYKRLLSAGLTKGSTKLSKRDSPEWDSLKKQYQDELDLKFALYCAIIDRLDQNVGRMIEFLRETGHLENTLIVFLSDNGSTNVKGLFGISGHKANPDNYHEWGRKGGWTSSLGRGWANVANTPFRRYKRETHEGGIATPCIFWPGRRVDLDLKEGSVTHEVAHVIDLLPTFVDLAEAKIPKEENDVAMKPKEGRSLVQVLEGGEHEPRTLFWEHEGNRAVRNGDWKLVALRGRPWELYHLDSDRSETRDLVAEHPAKKRSLQAQWQEWADRVGVRPWNEVVAAMKAYK